MKTNADFPDTVIGLGGAGIHLALTYLEQDWILERIVEPRERRPEKVGVQLSDTATEECSDVQARAIPERCDELQDHYRGEADSRPNWNKRDRLGRV